MIGRRSFPAGARLRRVARVLHLLADSAERLSDLSDQFDAQLEALRGEGGARPVDGDIAANPVFVRPYRGLDDR